MVPVDRRTGLERGQRTLPLAGTTTGRTALALVGLTCLPVLLGPGATGSVTFTGVAAGRYRVEASSARELATATSEPFTVGG